MTSHNQYKTKIRGFGKKIKTRCLIIHSEEETERKSPKIETKKSARHKKKLWIKWSDVDKYTRMRKTRNKIFNLTLKLKKLMSNKKLLYKKIQLKGLLYISISSTLNSFKTKIAWSNSK